MNTYKTQKKLHYKTKDTNKLYWSSFANQAVL